jgi:anti-sigma28 factor (negative regulator of flagellin synthesis)
MDPLHKGPRRDRRKKKSVAAAPGASAEKPADPTDVKGIDHERLKKIAKLKKAVEDGTYRVSNEEVARKLIEHMLEPKD